MMVLAKLLKHVANIPLPQNGKAMLVPTRPGHAASQDLIIMSLETLFQVLKGFRDVSSRTSAKEDAEPRGPGFPQLSRFSEPHTCVSLHVGIPVSIYLSRLFHG